ncbi:hypothetical protein [Desulforegula conservatrix]|uniref:hypothetical protein n=1 Tax=Desulforegula conservatrix TaxID=153026 RepID=UPI00047F7A4B|nr:hypothetical protein [Desulforegula conservatrix]
MTSFIKSFLTGTLVLFLGSNVAFAGSKDSKVKNDQHAQSKKNIHSLESAQLNKKDNGKLETEQSKIKEDKRTFNVDGTLTEKGHVKIITLHNYL